MVKHFSIEVVKNKSDLANYIRELRESLRENPDLWENADLESFLEAMYRWVDDSDGYFKNTQQPLPEKEHWQLVAAVLSAARIYE